MLRSCDDLPDANELFKWIQQGPEGVASFAHLPPPTNTRRFSQSASMPLLPSMRHKAAKEQREQELLSRVPNWSDEGVPLTANSSKAPPPAADRPPPRRPQLDRSLMQMRWQQAVQKAAPDHATDFYRATSQAMGRQRQYLDAVDEMLEVLRVPTPEFARSGQLPPLSLATQPNVPSCLPPSYGWQPPNAHEKLESYMYHEPGDRVRESLKILAEWRAGELGISQKAKNKKGSRGARGGGSSGRRPTQA